MIDYTQIDVKDGELIIIEWDMEQSKSTLDEVRHLHEYLQEHYPKSAIVFVPKGDIAKISKVNFDDLLY